LPEGILPRLVYTAEQRVLKGYYSKQNGIPQSKRSLKEALLKKDSLAIVAEVKYASPSSGFFGCIKGPAEIAKMYERAGATAISVLTDPDNFNGSLEHLVAIRKCTSIPLLMKDIIVDKSQIDAADACGADAVLLISSIFDRKLIDGELEEFIDLAHRKKLEVVLEVHTIQEYEKAVESEADIIGVNNRNLDTMTVSLNVSLTILQRKSEGKPVMCESGFSKRTDLLRIKKMGADAFLIGSVLMKAKNPEEVLRRLVGG
jgi:indole-3-glycerol phosphate synthase